MVMDVDHLVAWSLYYSNAFRNRKCAISGNIHLDEVDPWVDRYGKRLPEDTSESRDAHIAL
jgi:hypothetical protein